MEKKQAATKLITKHQLGDIDDKYLKKLITESVANADPLTSIKHKHLTTLESKLNFQAIEAYEIALHVNFQPVLVKDFLKIIVSTFNANVASLTATR